MLTGLIVLAVFAASPVQTGSSRSAVDEVVAPCPSANAGTPGASVGIGPTQQPRVVAPMVMPRVPPGLRKTTGAAIVSVRAIVDVDGRPCDLVVTSQSGPDSGADAVSLSAARQWRFEPATRDGGPVRATVTIDFRYEARAPQDEGGSPEWNTGLSVHGADYAANLWSRRDVSPLP